ncbi:MAG: threonine/serine dehydratase [Ahrensia sp.]|nr:threonine/serine dehydratase [Ahrensia sp.]
MALGPTQSQIEAAASALHGRIVATPTLRLNSSRFADALPEKASVHMKLELFQQAGSFKSRGVVLAIDALNQAERDAGVTAVSAGNHALATAWGARAAGLSAKVVMMKSADPVRVEGCKALGAEVVLADNVGTAFDTVEQIIADEGRTMLHPFESPHMTLGAATCGYELGRSVDHLDYAIVPVGGGGLISGMAPGLHAVHPDCTIIGVEPFGADSMYRSFEAGEAVRLDAVDTIADSLGAPMAMPNSFAIARDHVSEIVRLEDDALRQAMRLLMHGMKIMAEPACAATMAAICEPLRKRLAEKSVAIIACGSNISVEKFAALTN